MQVLKNELERLEEAEGYRIDKAKLRELWQSAGPVPMSIIITRALWQSANE